MKKSITLLAASCLLFTRGVAQEKFPIAIMAEGTSVRSEIGIAALIPWANKLWVETYVSHGDRRDDTGEKGVGLYYIDEDYEITRHPEAVTGTFANRMIHWESKQAIIGPHFISERGEVRTVPELTQYRLTANMEHLSDKVNMVYFLTMRGHIFEVNVNTLEARMVFEFTEENLPGEGHFKSGFTAHGKVIVAGNKFDFTEQEPAGVLAEWDGKNIKVIENKPFNEINGIPDYGGTVFATGWDKRSAILQIYIDGQWTRHRFPKASLTYDHGSSTEWMRIRQVESERFLMDLFGMFYELPPFNYDGKSWGIRPVSTHLHVIPDFVAWRGLIFTGSDIIEHDDDEVDGEPYPGQPTAGIWGLKIDDIWSWGKPKGWGAVWWEDEVESNTTSDPYIMTGFDKKVVHFDNQGEQDVTFTIEVDIAGNGSWKTYQSVKVPAGEYDYHIFPEGYSAHWVRVRVNNNGKYSVFFVYS